MKRQWQDIDVEDGVHGRHCLRVYDGQDAQKPSALVLYLRGGAFRHVDRDQSGRLVPQALAEAGCIVVEVDYGTPSDFGFPQVLDHAFGALSAVNGARKTFGATAKSLLFVAGEEAGGNVAAGVALKARDRMRNGLAGQILLSPMIDPMMASISIREADGIGMRERWADGWRHYLRDACGPQHPYAAPCICSRLSGVAPALLVTSQDDPLRDEVMAYGRRLIDAGVSVSQRILPAGSGWTGIYNEQTGPWIEALRAHVRRFVEEIRSNDRAPT